MAGPTGLTTADVIGADPSRRGLSGAALWCVLCIATLELAAGQAALAAEPANAFRNPVATQRGEGAGRHDAPNGMFGFRKLFGGEDSGEGFSEDELLSGLPTERLTAQAKARIESVTDRPTLYRRLPTQAINCDEDLFLLLTRKPETIIGIWDLMDITNVKAKRTGPYQFDASDGSGTTCKIDLIYGDRNLHVFFADGMYDGKFTQKPIRGKGVFVLKTSYAAARDGSTTVVGALDCYVKFESLGADLIARSLGVLIGKSADHNFTETAKFISQISGARQNNPHGMLDLAEQMPQVDEQTRSEFKQMIVAASRRHATRTAGAARMIRQPGVIPTPPAAPTSAVRPTGSTR